ncbi:hypothetical protein AB691_2417 [Stutzerimonas stutzeri]|nr:hypothetical protein AB691_2417 [Stutzerimonas stutzeri]
MSRRCRRHSGWRGAGQKSWSSHVPRRVENGKAFSTAMFVVGPVGRWVDR